MARGTERFPAQAGRTIVITRVFNAPRELVFAAWTKPEHLVRWHHAGEGWTTPFAETDVRPGGALRIGYGSPDGKDDFVLEGTYRQIVEPERIVFVMADGRPVTVILEDLGGKTNLTLELTLETEYPEAMQRQGWTEHLDNLADYLAKR
ncbi:MAG: SRPBCC domain-containing protein [Candidatus Limnocylindria bacterium]